MSPTVILEVILTIYLAIVVIPLKDKPFATLLITVVSVPTYKAHSHLPQQSADSVVDCINAEIVIVLSLWLNPEFH